MATEKNFRVKKGLEVQGPTTLNDSATITGNVTISGSGTLTVGGNTVSKVEVPALRDSNDAVVISDGLSALAIRSAIGAASAAASGGLDSAGIVSFVDSSYINHRLPADGVQLPFRTKQFQFISTAGQLEYTGNDIAGNALLFASDRFNVFYNGLLLPDSDFSTAGNNTLTLTDSAEAGDIVTVVTYEAANGIDSAEALKLIPTFGTDFVDSAAVNTLIDGRVTLSFGKNLGFLDSAEVVQAAQDTITKAFIQAYDFLDSSEVVTAASAAITPSIPTFGTDFVDSAAVSTLITSTVTSGYIQTRQGLIDSSLVTQLVDSAYVALRDKFNDSDGVLNFVDSDYVQLRQRTYNTSDFPDSAFVTGQGYITASSSDTLTNKSGNISMFTNDANYLDSTYTSALIDSSYIQLRQSFSDSASIITLVDSDYVQARSPLTTTADFPDSAGVNTLIDARVNATFINNLTIDADTLGGQAGSYYLNYNNFSNTPTIPTFGTDYVDSGYVASQGYITASSSDTLTNKSGNISMFTNDADYLDSTYASALIDSDYIELRRPPEVIFNVVNSGASAYAFTGDGFSSSANNPTLYLQRGLTYKFSVSASGHPFQIRVSDGGSAYNTGVTNNGLQSGTLLFTPDMSAPNTLVYQCTAHSGMVGNIIIVDDNTFVDSARVSSIITADVDATFINNLTIDADTLGGQGGSYYLNYNNFSNTPTIPTFGTDFIDSATANTLANARIAASDLSALSNVHTTNPTHDQILKWDSANQYWYPADSSAAGGGGISGITVQEEGSSLSTVGTILNFVGSNVTASGTGATKTITITGGSGGLDSALTTQLIDSAYVQLRQSASSGGGVDSAATIALIDSSYVQARQAAGAGFTVQDEGSSLSTLATTLNFTGAGVTATGTGASKTINIPGGSATGSFQSDRITITEFTADSGQTTFTGLDYTVGKTQVFLNGIQLVNTSDYTATNGSSVVLGSGADSGNTVTVISHKLQDQLFTAATNISNYFYTNTLVADSSVTSFGGADDAGNTLSYTPGKLQVYLNGIFLKDSDDYTASSGTNVVLTQAADSDDVISIVTYITENTTGGATRIDNFYYTADSGQTAFTGADDDGNTLSYAADRLQVYLNGILLRDSADYTATNGSTITLLEGTDSADILTVSAFTTKPTGKFDSASIQGFIDSAYVQARQTASGVDSAATIALIDSAYVQLRQDKAYSSLTGAPTIPSFGTDFVDSAFVTTSIATKMPLAGGTFTGDVAFDSAGGILFDKSDQALEFGDNYRLKLGASEDLHIFHSGSQSSILDNGTGPLNIRGSVVNIRNVGNTEEIAVFTQNAGVDLYYDNNKKFETTSTGVKTTGTLDINGAYSFPTTIGTAGQVLKVPSSGTVLEYGEGGGGGGSSVDSAAITTIVNTKLATTDLTDFIGADGQANQVLKSLGDGNVDWTNLVIPEFTPASSTAVGTRGEITFDSSYLYVAVATNNWNRIAWTDSSW